jgi:hypothetical protein
MKRRLVLAITIGAAALAVATQTQAMSAPKLNGVTGQGGAFKISLKDSTGKVVKSLKAGSYTFVIKDGSSIHNFSLDGPNKFAKTLTKLPFVGTSKPITISLKKGKYKFYCENHESQMFGNFQVT